MATIRVLLNEWCSLCVTHKIHTWSTLVGRPWIMLGYVANHANTYTDVANHNTQICVANPKQTCCTLGGKLLRMRVWGRPHDHMCYLPLHLMKKMLPAASLAFCLSCWCPAAWIIIIMEHALSQYKNEKLYEVMVNSEHGALQCEWNQSNLINCWFHACKLPTGHGKLSSKN